MITARLLIFCSPLNMALVQLLLSSSGNFNLEINFWLAGNNRDDLDISQYGLAVRARSFALLLAQSLAWFWPEHAGPNPNDPQPWVSR